MHMYVYAHAIHSYATPLHTNMTRSHAHIYNFVTCHQQVAFRIFHQPSPKYHYFRPRLFKEEALVRLSNGMRIYFHKLKQNLHAAATSEATLAATVLAVSAAAEGGTAALAAELVLLAVAALGTAGGLLVRGRDDLGGKGEVGAEVLDALVGEVAVVVLPVEGDADEATAGEGLHEHHDLEVGGALDVGVGGGDGVLLDDEDALLEEVGEGGDAVGFGDEHLCLYLINRIFVRVERGEVSR